MFCVPRLFLSFVFVRSLARKLQEFKQETATGARIFVPPNTKRINSPDFQIAVTSHKDEKLFILSQLRVPGTDITTSFKQAS